MSQKSDMKPDVELARAAQCALQSTTYLPEGSIRITADNGWLTLSGEVEWDYQRRAATHAVRHLIGVVGVNEKITIRPNTFLSAVKSEIEAALRRRTHADAQQVSVEVRGAEVTLTGTVKSWSERELAASSAWATPGVRRVFDNITIAC